MKTYVTLFLLLLLSYTNAWPQDKGVWTAFFDPDNIRGFKDASGKVMIEPKFTGFTRAIKFDQIIMGMEYTPEEGFEDYYLLKNGRQFGHDSVYYPGLTFYCESEGLIPFMAESGVGMFNGQGKIAIPAMYNDVSACRNGYIVALAGAEKKWDGEYSYWDGGINSLIDRNNKIIINNFNLEDDVDFYSAQVTDNKPTDPNRIAYKANDGKYHSFIDNKKLFTEFLEKELLANPMPDKLIAASYAKLVYWDDGSDGWIWRKNAGFIKDNFELIAQRLLEIKKPDADFLYSYPSSIQLPDDLEDEFNTYKNNCGDFNSDKHPIRKIIITHIEKDKNGNPVMAGPQAPVATKEGYAFYQESFTFLKTESGFKLVSLSLHDAEFK